MTELAVMKLIKEDLVISNLIQDRVDLSYMPQGEIKPTILLIMENVNRSLYKDNDTHQRLEISIISIAEKISDAVVLDGSVYSLLQNFKGNVNLSNNTTVNISHAYQVSSRQEYDEQIEHTVVTSEYVFFSQIINSN